MTEGHHSGSDAQAAQGPGHSLWQACLDQLAQELPEQQFNTWIKPLTAEVSDDLSKVTILVANRFKLDWVRAQYSSRISSLIEAMSGQSVQVELALALRESSTKSYSSQAPVDRSGADEPLELGEDKSPGVPKNRLNTALTVRGTLQLAGQNSVTVVDLAFDHALSCIPASFHNF